MDALLGVVLGVVLTALLGAWRDRQQHDQQERAALRDQRLAAVADFLAATDRLWRRRSDMVLEVDRMRDAREQGLEQEAARHDESADEAGAVLRLAVQEADIALTRLQLLCPTLASDAEHLLKVCREYDYMKSSGRAAINDVHKKLLDAARAVLALPA